MKPATRKLIGMLILLTGLIAYIALIVTIATTWLPAHWAVQLGFYAVAGIIWALPLRPLMAWMNQSEDA